MRISHGGWNYGFVTNIARPPDDRVCNIVRANLNTSAIQDIDWDLASIVFGEKSDAPRDHIAIKVDRLVFT